MNPWKALKRYVKLRLFDLCDWLDHLSLWLQKRVLRTTLAMKRAVTNLDMPLDQMDQDLLGMYIRWNGHHVEKTVRYEKSQGRGASKPALLRSALDEWHRRSYPRRRWIEWAEA